MFPVNGEARFPPKGAGALNLGPLYERPYFFRCVEAIAPTMLFIVKAVVSGLLVALVATIARRYPGWGGLLASLPLVSVLAMLWLYAETRETERVAALAGSTFWFLLPSMPMFLVIPWLLRSGWSFAATMAVAIGLTMLLYAGMSWLAPRVGIVL